MCGSQGLTCRTVVSARHFSMGSYGLPGNCSRPTRTPNHAHKHTHRYTHHSTCNYDRDSCRREERGASRERAAPRHEFARPFRSLAHGAQLERWLKRIDELQQSSLTVRSDPEEALVPRTNRIAVLIKSIRAAVSTDKRHRHTQNYKCGRTPHNPPALIHTTGAIADTPTDPAASRLQPRRHGCWTYPVYRNWLSMGCSFQALIHRPYSS